MSGEKSEEQNIKERFVKQGLMYAELNEYFAKEFLEEGYSGMELRAYDLPVQIILRVGKTHDVLGEKKSRIKQVKTLVAKRMGIPEANLEISVEMVRNKGLCPMTQAEVIRSKIGSGVQYKRVVNGVMKTIMEAGAQGCEIVISGKLKGQRARSAKFVEGRLIHTGGVKEEYMRSATTSVLLKLGVIGIKVTIMLPHDPEGIDGPSRDMVDKIKVLEPTEIIY
ncbi:40S ribosomal protein S3 [Astathelohania contejeani]|uniref:40S ribosomal protein S3 n=1 Tax=Astathelohania contejeani TaxID=164912 RepID=A0ABQ7I1K0_9MICR|nr:40S ribosomal protein S3 [Thelohania contejeani]